MTEAAFPPAEPQFDDRIARRNMWVLIAAQAILGAQMPVIFTIAGLAGSSLASNPCWATLPISLAVIGSMLWAQPLSAIMQRWGRRAGFVTGALSGALGAVLAAWGLQIGSFPLFAISGLFTGGYMSAQGFYRFAAADMASEAYRPKVISGVMAGGLASAVFGPQLVKYTAQAFVIPFLGSYLTVIALNLLGMFLFAALHAPRPVVRAAGAPQGRSRMELLRSPAIAVAVICATVSYALMNLVMMYAPSFFTGALIARFGAVKIILAGMALIVAAAIAGHLGTTVPHFWAGMILVGLGWNFGFIGASALVTETHRPSERTKVQSFNDFLVFGTMVVGSFSSGRILVDFGWDMVNMIVFPLVFIGIVALFSVKRFESRRLA